MNNLSVRIALTKYGVKYFQLAQILGVSVSTLNRRFRDELPDSEQQKIVRLIEEFKKGGNKDGKH